MKRLLISIIALTASAAAFAQNIEFLDPYCKEICVKYFDADSDGEISMAEAAAVKDIKKSFFRSNVVSFDEFRYFTSVTKVPTMAFRGSALQSITIPESVTEIGKGAFADCASLSSVNLPSGLKSIEDTAFSGCTSLASVSIPAEVTLIGYQAFGGCAALTSLTVPASIDMLGDDAFFGTGIVTLTVKAKKAPSCPALSLPKSVREIIVPKSSLSSYKTEEGWENFASLLKGE